MARYTGPVCKLCRREGQKLFLKGQKCYTEKCPVERRAYPPGQHGPAQARRRKQSDYAVQLREKQKVKRIYGVLERQFRRTFDRAAQQKGVVGETLLIMLERRLDNTVYRLGFGSSRPQARQLVSHGHVRVNDKKVDIPSFEVKVGDVITLSTKAAKNGFVLEAVEAVKGRGMPRWLELSAEQMTGKVVALPARDDVNFPNLEQLIV
jgi:small subunit ribosomal protein S4